MNTNPTPEPTEPTAPTAPVADAPEPSKPAIRKPRHPGQGQGDSQGQAGHDAHLGEYPLDVGSGQC